MLLVYQRMRVCLCVTIGGASVTALYNADAPHPRETLELAVVLKKTKPGPKTWIWNQALHCWTYSCRRPSSLAFFPLSLQGCVRFWTQWIWRLSVPFGPCGAATRRSVASRSKAWPSPGVKRPARSPWVHCVIWMTAIRSSRSWCRAYHRTSPSVKWRFCSTSLTTSLTYRSLSKRRVQRQMRQTWSFHSR